MNANDAMALTSGSTTPGGIIVLVLLLVLFTSLLLGVVGWFLKDMRLRMKEQFDEQSASLRELRDELLTDVRAIRTAMTEEVRELRTRIEMDGREVRDRLDGSIRALERATRSETDRIWQHIARHEKTLAERFCLRDDWLQTMSSLEAKLDRRLEAIEGRLP